MKKKNYRTKGTALSNGMFRHPMIIRVVNNKILLLLPFKQTNKKRSPKGRGNLSQDLQREFLSAKDPEAESSFPLSRKSQEPPC